ncbi:hypothetical protein MJO28_011749 [Puccinia striiformis f. sp. tritici]|uniref:Uncharacterized protein n=2 Tax=Puccinia striiformis f. sp. tritici TaxID=168172 RepID=A0A0L0W089_9BASI|nr:hypothetical protein Pst134EB_022208 [Puccinia striiformis f. sp. tritici]KAI7944221.1 hypothetical protein MJO28_011749 [Puccinia striiformis f. sp. tritici]KAI9614640.1 hypothetical protein H4Q26_009023 [Puccinia striiformis f. sp. tritici PST-130]KNF04934.1 hypothetical protein PSTG_01990 [Puccinia striiformis f. sp. tritici PST-78]
MVAFTLSFRTKTYRSHRHCSKIGYILFALITLLPTSQSASNDSYSYLDPRFVYTPKDQWHLNDSLANVAYTNSSGAKVTTQFFGSAVYLSSTRRADQYRLQVIIDDVDKYIVDLNGPSTSNAPQEVLWGVKLVEGNHTFQAINMGADPDRPFVAFASLTITTGQPTNSAPAVSSQSFHSVGEDDDEHAKKNSLIRRVTGGVGALAGFIALVFLAYREQRRRHRRQLQQDLHSHRLATQTAKSASPDPAMVTPSPSLQYVAIRPPSSTYTREATYPDPAGSRLIISEDRASSVSSREGEDESEFWRPRKTSTSSN